jgi:hypothetical protein
MHITRSSHTYEVIPANKNISQMSLKCMCVCWRRIEQEERPVPITRVEVQVRSVRYSLYILYCMLLERTVCCCVEKGSKLNHAR